MMTLPEDAQDARARLRKRRLAGYALAAGAAVAWDQQADAGVVYSGVRDEMLTFSSGVHLDFSLTALPSQVGPTVDFVFADIAGSNYRSLGMFGKNNGLPHNGEVRDAQGNIAGLNTGDPVGPTQPFTTQAVVNNGQPGYFVQHLVSSYNGSTVGNFLGAQGKFVGLRFQIPADNSTHYGWARISVDANFDLTLTDWAYESTANQEIVAGDTGVSAVPEPATLGMLALGAVAAGAITRRRQTKAV